MVVCGWRCAFAVPVAVTVLGILSVAADSHSSRLLIETQDLAGLLSNHAVRIIDARPADEYRQGHIPGAVNLPAPATDDLGANRRGLPLPSDRAEELFRTACVNNNSRVVVYDDQGNRFAARLFYVLESFGHSQVQVLNGGIPKWKSEGRPLSKEVPTLRAGDFIPKVDASPSIYLFCK